MNHLLVLVFISLTIIHQNEVSAKAMTDNGQGLVGWRRYQGKADHGKASNDKLSDEKRMLLLKMKDLLENTLNDFDNNNNNIEVIDEHPTVERRQQSIASAALPWKRVHNAAPQKGAGIPWTGSKRQSQYSAAIPWKRTELYNRLIRDVNELFTLEDQTDAKREMSEGEKRIENEIREVDELTSTFDRMV